MLGPLADDIAVARAAVSQRGNALCLVSERLKNCREVVLAAVGQDGWALDYASESLKRDKELVEIAKRSMA